MISAGGFFGKLGRGLGALTGGILGTTSGQQARGYTSPNVKEYEDKYKRRLYDRLGPSGSSKPLSGAQGMREAKEGFDFKPVDSAIAGYSSGPTKFNFSKLPEQYGSQAYNRVAGDIRRQGAGALEQARNLVGSRRPGLLSKIATDITRDTGEQLAGARTGIGLQRMLSDVDLGKQEQLATEDSRLAQLQGLGRMGMGKLGQEQAVLGGERRYQDEALQRLADLFGQTSGGTRQEAADRRGQATARRGQTLDALGAMAPIAGAAMFSDSRLKTNIKLTGKSPTGVNIYTFQYRDAPGTFEGVMAQEVPHAAMLADNGYLMVDYSKLDVDFKRLS